MFLGYGEVVNESVAGIRLEVGTDILGTSTQLGPPRRFARSYSCRDLLSAIYLQFYLFITSDKPTRYCENPACGMPFLVTRKDKWRCNDTCRSNARHYREREQQPAS